MWNKISNPNDPKQLPKLNKPILAIVEHWYTHSRRYVLLKHVKESDQSWRTVDDNSELSYDWNVTHWQQLQKLPHK